MRLPLSLGYILPMLAFATILFFLISAHLSSPLPDPSGRSLFSYAPHSVGTRFPTAFTDVAAAFSSWDEAVGCSQFAAKYANAYTRNSTAIRLAEGECDASGVKHVSVLVRRWTWIPDTLDGVYPCRCGIGCLWSRSPVTVDRPDVELFEGALPPQERRKGDPLRVYLDLEASRARSGFEDIFVGYHANDDVQVTYAGKSFHIRRSYHVSRMKRNDTLVYWSSSRCLPKRDKLAKRFLSKVSHHSFGKCLNNVGGLDVALSFYPECGNKDNHVHHWSDHLHCAMSHYKFVLAIENTRTDSYVTEKLFYALEAGAVPIYFGAPNVWDFVPPNSIIDGSKFKSVDEVASYVKALAKDPVAYAEYHAWRRCGVFGNYLRTREASIDTLPCRLCELVSRKGGKDVGSS